MRPLLLLAALLVGASNGSYAQTAQNRQLAVKLGTWRWEDEILQFEAADRQDPPKPGGILFVGSSSIRLWPQLRADFPGQSVIQRGFGGSDLPDIIHFAPRIVLPYKPKLIFLYEGDNDLAEGRTPLEVFHDYKAFVGVVHRALPSTRIVYISIKPSPERWAFAPKARVTNALIADYTATNPWLSYVDVFTPMLGDDGLPRDELYDSDHLHMNSQGYALWKQLLTPHVRVPPVISGIKREINPLH